MALWSWEVRLTEGISERRSLPQRKHDFPFRVRRSEEACAKKIGLELGFCRMNAFTLAEVKKGVKGGVGDGLWML